MLVPAFTGKGTEAEGTDFYFEFSLCHHSGNPLLWESPSPLFSPRSPISPVFHFFLFLDWLPCFCCWERMNRNNFLGGFMSAKCFYLTCILDWQFGWIKNSLLAIIFLQNFEGIASSLSRFCCCEVPYPPDSWFLLYSQGFGFLFCFVSGNLLNLFVPHVLQFYSDVSWHGPNHLLCQAAGTSFSFRR